MTDRLLVASSGAMKAAHHVVVRRVETAEVRPEVPAEARAVAARDVNVEARIATKCATKYATISAASSAASIGRSGQWRAGVTAGLPRHRDAAPTEIPSRCPTCAVMRGPVGDRKETTDGRRTVARPARSAVALPESCGGMRREESEKTRHVPPNVRHRRGCAHRSPARKWSTHRNCA